MSSRFNSRGGMTYVYLLNGELTSASNELQIYLFLVDFGGTGDSVKSKDVLLIFLVLVYL